MRPMPFAILLLLVSSLNPSAPFAHAATLSAPSHIAEATPPVDEDGDDSPLKLAAERLFRETRFSQYFFAHAKKGSLNQLPAQGDQVVESLDTIRGRIQNPYQGQAISCATCHFVEQANDLRGGGSRAYTDFSRRSLIPHRGDSFFQTPRNSPIMVGSTVNPNFLLHGDGEFASPEDLVRDSYFGRNLGWLPTEKAQGMSHMAAVIREDNGHFVTETDLKGISYRKLLAGDASVPAKFLIPPEYRFDIDHSTDAQIVDGVIKLVAGYLNSLDFKKDAQGNYKGSPFDVFLRKNKLPQKPDAGETDQAYTLRLANQIRGLKTISSVTKEDGAFTLHNQEFTFSEDELRGFAIFTGSGRCVQCHAAPDFTDHGFHNTGASQFEYDGVHGAGHFNQLVIPNLKIRNQQKAFYLPASENNPEGQSTYRHAPVATAPAYADLGVWNIFGNSDMPKPQAALRQAICDSVQIQCDQVSDDELLNDSVGLIKTPTLRDLGQSAPYLHSGQMNRLQDVLAFYMQVSEQARQGQLRNADPRIKLIRLQGQDLPYLEKFLKSLNEDYD